MPNNTKQAIDNEQQDKIIFNPVHPLKNSCLNYSEPYMSIELYRLTQLMVLIRLAP